MATDASKAPMGANLAEWGATFRVWAPTAKTVSVAGNFNNWAPQPLDRANTGYWSLYVPGVKELDQYKYYVEGIGTTGWKRDPYARSLTRDPPYPNCNCSVT